MSRISKVLFIGSKRLGLKCLEELRRIDPDSLAGVMTLDDRDDPRNAFADFQEFASRNKLDLPVAKNRRDSESIIQNIKPELCIVNGWYWLIGDQTLASVPHGFLGLHNSLLPKYRGGSPLVWTIINGEKTTGLSLFSFTSGMDEGDIWAQESIPIESGDYIGDILLKLEAKAIAMLREKYPQILNCTLEPVPQNNGEATYCAMRIPDDGLINWEWPAVRVYNFIRAQAEPYPGAFTLMAGKRLTIWRAQLLDLTYYGTPGQVARIADDGVIVICGDCRPLLIEDVEYENVRQKAANAIKSIKTRFR